MMLRKEIVSHISEKARLHLAFFRVLGSGSRRDVPDILGDLLSIFMLSILPNRDQDGFNGPSKRVEASLGQ